MSRLPRWQPMNEPTTASAHPVAAGRLDLDHVGAEVGEEHRSERAGEELAEVDDPQPFQRPGHQIDPPPPELRDCRPRLRPSDASISSVCAPGEGLRPLHRTGRALEVRWARRVG